MADPITAGLIIGSLGLAGGTFFASRSSRGGGAASVTPSAVPQVADDSGAKKRQRVGRNALILSNQEDILGGEASTSRNVLTAI